MAAIIIGVVVGGFMIATCSSNDATSACPTPVPNTKEAQILNDARSQAGIPVLYPCQLPAGEDLTSYSVTGDKTHQQVELVFGGPFDLRLRQSQVPPARNEDPTGASHSTVSLFANIQGQLIELNDGTNKATYHLLWTKDGLYYEVQAVGPPLGRDYIINAAKSLAASGGLPLTPPATTPLPTTPLPAATPTQTR